MKNISQLQTAVDILATEVNELKLKHNDLKRTDETNEDELSLKEKELEEMLEQSVHNQTLLQKEEMQLNEQMCVFRYICFVHNDLSIVTRTYDAGTSNAAGATNMIVICIKFCVVYAYAHVDLFYFISTQKKQFEWCCTV